MDESRPTRLILIPAGKTCWEDEDRLVGNAELPLCPDGIENVTSWSEQLREASLEMIFCIGGGAAEETARLVGDTIKIKPKLNKDLSEINLGLWQGMLLEEVKTRHPKVYKQWLDSPERVTPPEGESLVEAQERLNEAVRKLIKKNQSHCLAIVLGPIGLTLVRLSREGKSLTDFWPLMKEPATWHEYVVDSNK